MQRRVAEPSAASPERAWQIRGRDALACTNTDVDAAATVATATDGWLLSHNQWEREGKGDEAREEREGDEGRKGKGTPTVTWTGGAAGNRTQAAPPHTQQSSACRVETMDDEPSRPQQTDNRQNASPATGAHTQQHADPRHLTSRAPFHEGDTIMVTHGQPPAPFTRQGWWAGSLNTAWCGTARAHRPTQCPPVTSQKARGHGLPPAATALPPSSIACRAARPGQQHPRKRRQRCHTWAAALLGAQPTTLARAKQDPTKSSPP